MQKYGVFLTNRLKVFQANISQIRITVYNKGMNLFDRYLYLNCIICLILLLSVACTSTSTPTPIPPTAEKIATSTPFPTPLPQFATVTPISTIQDDTGNSQTVLATDSPAQTSFAGTISGQSDTVTLYNGPQGAVKGEINNRASIVVLGKSDDGLWIEIHLTGDINGWVQASYIDTDVSVNDLIITGYVPNESPTPSPDAIVKSDAAGLRLRTQPNTDSNVLTNLDSNSILTVIGRSGDSEWLQVIAPNRQRGWAMAQFLDVNIDVLRLPVTFGANPTPSDDIPESQPTDVITNITAQAQRIFDRGLTVGNRANVFSKIGDSLTVATWAFYPIGWGQQQLSSYGYLQPAIDYFSAEPVGDGNSFSNVPLAADNQWTTADLLDPTKGNPEICGINETPLDCEFRIVRPSIALILIGTNDVGTMDGVTYRENLETILDKTIARSVLPILSTLPRRSGYDAQIDEFNDIIRTTAQQYQIPIWEFYNALESRPNSGLEEDGVHLSYPPVEVGQWEAAVNFVGDNLNYGYNVRNLTAIQVLDAVWRQVILGETP